MRPLLLTVNLENKDVVHVVVALKPWFCGGVTYALACTGWLSSAASFGKNSRTGGQVRSSLAARGLSVGEEPDQRSSLT